MRYGCFSKASDVVGSPRPWWFFKTHFHHFYHSSETDEQVYIGVRAKCVLFVFVRNTKKCQNVINLVIIRKLSKLKKWIKQWLKNFRFKSLGQNEFLIKLVYLRVPKIYSFYNSNPIYKLNCVI